MVQIPEQIQKDIDSINAVAKDLKMQLYVVGGFPRDIVSGIGITDETDLDVTEANGNAFDLAFFVAAKYNLPEPVVYAATGTALVTLPSGRSVEFHNAFKNVPHIIDQLYVLGIEPTPLNKDVYARDFTLNTLLLDPDNNDIIDITGTGISDIQNKILRTPLPARKSLSLNPRNILRAIRFKIQFGLEESEDFKKEALNFVPELINFLQTNPNSKMVQSTVKKTLGLNPEQAVKEYKRYGILPYLPKELAIDKEIKKDMFGTTISPISLKQTAQTKMQQRMQEEREKHKAYMRRKKREDKQNKTKKLDIMDKVRSGYYYDNPEPEYMQSKKKEKKRQILDLVRQRDYQSLQNENS